MELTIGDFVVLPFGPITDAAGMHTELKKAGIDAAVVDHAYVLSRLQLSAALSRIQPFHGVTAMTISTSKQRKTAIREKMARLVFVSLSLTRNLDRVLQVLPPGPATSAVVVILSKQAATAEVRATIRSVCQQRSTTEAASEAAGSASTSAAIAPGPRSPAADDVEAYVYHTLAARADASKVMSFYGVTERDLRAVKQGFTSEDIAALEAMARRCGPEEGGVDVKLLLNVRALELCVVNRLATADV